MCSAGANAIKYTFSVKEIIITHTHIYIYDIYYIYIPNIPYICNVRNIYIYDTYMIHKMYIINTDSIWNRYYISDIYTYIYISKYHI